MLFNLEVNIFQFAINVKFRLSDKGYEIKGKIDKYQDRQKIACLYEILLLQKKMHMIYDFWLTDIIFTRKLNKYALCIFLRKTSKFTQTKSTTQLTFHPF